MSEFGTSQFLSPKKLAWVMDVGETTVADWLKPGERGRPPMITHFRQGRIIRVMPEEALRFVWAYTLRAGDQNRSVEPLNCRTLNPEQFEVLAARLERHMQLQISDFKFQIEGRAAA